MCTFLKIQHLWHAEGFRMILSPGLILQGGNSFGGAWSWSARHFQHVVVSCDFAATSLPSTLAQESRQKSEVNTILGDFRWKSDDHCKNSAWESMLGWSSFRSCVQWRAWPWNNWHSSVRRRLVLSDLRSVERIFPMVPSLSEHSVHPVAKRTVAFKRISWCCRLSNLVWTCGTLIYVEISLLAAIQTLAVELPLRPCLDVFPGNHHLASLWQKLILPLNVCKRFHFRLFRLFRLSLFILWGWNLATLCGASRRCNMEILGLLQGWSCISCKAWASKKSLQKPSCYVAHFHGFPRFLQGFHQRG